MAQWHTCGNGDRYWGRCVTHFNDQVPNSFSRFTDDEIHHDAPHHTGENMDVRGEIEFDVRYGDQRKSLPLVIVAGNGPTLLGRNWLQHIRLDWKELNAATVHHSSADTLESIRKRYESTVFGEGLGHNYYTL